MRTSFFVRRLRLIVLSLCVLLICVSWHSFSSHLFPSAALPSFITNITSAKSAQANLTQRALAAQQGLTAYREYRYTDAIEAWENALSLHAEESPAERAVTESAVTERAILLENLARAYQQVGNTSEALKHWQLVASAYVEQQNWTKVNRALTQQAQIYRQLGQPYQAIGHLCTSVTESVDSPVSLLESCEPESAIALARQTNDTLGEISAIGSLGEAYRSLQRYDTAIQVLQVSLSKAQTVAESAATDSPDSRRLNRRLEARLHNSLGSALNGQAQLSYQQAIIARRSVTGGEQLLHNTAANYHQKALKSFKQSERLANELNEPTLEVKAILGQLEGTLQEVMPIAQRTSPTAEAVQSRHQSLRRQAIAQLGQLPPNQETAYLSLQLTKRPQILSATETSSASRSQCKDLYLDADTLSLLQQANEQARALSNNRLLSFAQGEIGHYYECMGDYDTALIWSEQARLSASGDRISAIDTLYLWQWQTGRLYHKKRQRDRAIEYYSRAVDNLDRVRAEILSSDRNLQFDFRDTVAPVYRELAEIRLASVTPVESQQKSDTSDSNRASVKAALGNIDSLQLAELQNYFGSDCLVPVADFRLDDVLSREIIGSRSPEQTDSEQTDTEQTGIERSALVSTVIFPEKTAVILTLPEQTPQLHWINLPEDRLRASVITFRNSLEDTANELEGYDKTTAQQLYAQIIAPFKSILDAQQIKTLIFVNDGILRNVPMAALHDGQQYLVEQYALAIAPSLQKTVASKSSALPSRALILGLSQNSTVAGQQFASLPAVEREVQEVLSVFPKSDVLLNEAFTKDNLAQNLSDNTYPVLHIATHGKFESAPNKTFLVTGAKENSVENKLLRLGELDALVRTGLYSETASASAGDRTQPNLLNLIVLSACQTATGDERSSLGLAGVTIRAGARTALASLWSVDDESTADLVTYFYQNWNSGLSKSEALRQAQIAVLKDTRYFQHPAYWSAFMLVGDWQ